MSITAVNGSLSAQQNEQVTNTKSSRSSPQQQNVMPQDTVDISSAAKQMQGASSAGDVDHDGDSK